MALSEDIEISDDGDDVEREDPMDEEALRHAKTLRLDDFANPPAPKGNTVPEPDSKIDQAANEAQLWKAKYEEMERRLKAMEMQRTLGPFETPTPKKLFESPVVKAPEGLPPGGPAYPPVKASQPLPSPPPVPKEGAPKPSAAKSQSCPVSTKASSQALVKAAAKAPAPMTIQVPPKASSPAQTSMDVRSGKSPEPAAPSPASAAPSETEIQEGEETLAEILDLSGEEGPC